MGDNSYSSSKISETVPRKWLGYFVFICIYIYYFCSTIWCDYFLKYFFSPQLPHYPDGYHPVIGGEAAWLILRRQKKMLVLWNLLKGVALWHIFCKISTREASKALYSNWIIYVSILALRDYILFCYFIHTVVNRSKRSIYILLCELIVQAPPQWLKQVLLFNNFRRQWQWHDWGILQTDSLKAYLLKLCI